MLMTRFKFLLLRKEHKCKYCIKLFPTNLILRSSVKFCASSTTATRIETENELLRNFINNGADINLTPSSFGFPGVAAENLRVWITGTYVPGNYPKRCQRWTKGRRLSDSPSWKHLLLLQRIIPPAVNGPPHWAPMAARCPAKLRRWLVIFVNAKGSSTVTKRV